MTSKLLKILATVFLVLMIFGGIVFFKLTSQTERFAVISLCEDDALKEIESPTKAFTVKIYLKNCGATTGYTTHVNISKKHDKFNNKEDEFIKNEIFSIEGTPEIKVIWIDENNLEIGINDTVPPYMGFFGPIRIKVIKANVKIEN